MSGNSTLGERLHIDAGVLTFDGCDTVALAEQYGTPLYVVSEGIIRDRCDQIRTQFLGKYARTEAVYASKAFQTLDMCALVNKAGLGVDVVSGGELYCALRSGTDPSRIVFHGNSKTREELEYAVGSGVGRIVADNLNDIEEIERIAALAGKKQKVLYRITPGVDSHTHQFIATGTLDSKFGIPLDPSAFPLYMKAALGAKHVDFTGFHFHVGSQLLDNDSHLAATRILLDLVEKVRTEYGFEPRELNLGGGFGIRYTEHDMCKPVSYFLDPMMALIDDWCRRVAMDRPRITIEPGRWIIGEAGITLYRAGSLKEIPGLRTYLGVDGGMTDNPRPMLYEARYRALVANRASAVPDTLVTIAGRNCESGDILIKDVKLASPRTGDIIAVLSTGAYNHSMASTYNRVPRPAVVMVREGTSRLSVRRETYEDLVAREIF